MRQNRITQPPIPVLNGHPSGPHHSDPPRRRDIVPVVGLFLAIASALIASAIAFSSKVDRADVQGIESRVRAVESGEKVHDAEFGHIRDTLDEIKTELRDQRQLLSDIARKVQP